MPNPAVPYDPEMMAFQQARETLADFTKWRFNPEEILLVLEHDLKGDQYNEKKAMWEPTDKKLLNDEGVRTIISLVRTSINKVTFLSNLTMEEITTICRDLNLALVDTLFFKWESFELEKDHLDLIVSKIMNFIFVGMKQAENGITMESMTKMEKVVRSYEHTKQKKSGFSAFGPFGGKGEEGT